MPWWVLLFADEVIVGVAGWWLARHPEVGIAAGRALRGLPWMSRLATARWLLRTRRAISRFGSRGVPRLLRRIGLGRVAARLPWGRRLGWAARLLR